MSDTGAFIRKNLDLEGVRELASELSNVLRSGDVFLLYGDLGAGKTTFARYLIQAITSPEEEVPSPTFTLMQTYDTSKGQLCHVDLYRIEDSEEVLELGLEDYFHDSICVVEWPERMGGYLPKSFVRIDIKIRDDNFREFTFSPKGQVDGDLIAAFKSL